MPRMTKEEFDEIRVGHSLYDPDRGDTRIVTAIVDENTVEVRNIRSGRIYMIDPIERGYVHCIHRKAGPPKHLREREASFKKLRALRDAISELVDEL